MHNIEQIKIDLQIKDSNCLTCKHHTNENGFEECLLKKPKANLVSFPFKKDQDCWSPYFWNSNLVMHLNRCKSWNDAIYYEFERITGTHLSDDVDDNFLELSLMSKICYAWFCFRYHKN